MKLSSNLNRDVIMKRQSFTSIEKDTQLIIENLFINNKKISKELKSLILIPQKNCLTEIEEYSDLINSFSLSKMVDEGYIRLAPKLSLDFNSNVQSSLIITTDLITPRKENTSFSQYSLSIIYICNLDIWTLDNFQQRPIEACGLMNGILEGLQLTGIGHLEYKGTSRITPNERMGGYISTYVPVISKEEDRIPND